MHIFESQSANIQIDSYTPGAFFKILGVEYPHSLLLTPQKATPWSLDSIGSLSETHIEALLIYKPTIVLIGTGFKQQFINPSLLAPLMKHRIGFEIMSTAAACRTFTILSNDDRNVLAALCLS